MATTSLEYYSSGAGKRGQLKEVIDPNGVETRFDYDTWGQQTDYDDGCQGTDCATTLSCQIDSAGRAVTCGSSGTTTGGGGGGPECGKGCEEYTHEEAGWLMEIGCFPCPACTEVPGPDYGPFRPNQLTTPIRIGEWAANPPFAYTPRGELRDASAIVS